MKTITKLLFVFSAFALSFSMSAQWASPGSFAHNGNAELEALTAHLAFDANGTITATSYGGLRFRENGSTQALLWRNCQNNRLYYGGTGTVPGTDDVWSVSDVSLNNTTTTSGIMTVGDSDGLRLSFDNNEVQCHNGTTTSTLFLNFWGSETAICTGNNTGDLRVGSGTDLFVDNSAGRTGLGTAAPGAKLHVNVTGSDGIFIDGNDTGDARLRIENGGGNHWIFDDDSDGHDLKFQSANDLAFLTSGSTDTKVSITTGGNLQVHNDDDISFLDGSDVLRYQIQTFTNGIEIDCASGDYSVGLDASGTGDIYFNTQDGFEKMRLTDIGRLGIGTASPLSDMHISDAGEVAGIIVERTDASNYVNLLSGTTGNSFYFARARRFSIVPSSSITSTSPNVPNSWFVYGPDWGTPANAGNTGLGTDAPTEKLHVNGNLRVNATIITSDRRLKSDIADFGYGLEEVKKLQPVSFTYNGRGGTTEGSQHIGLIAQELQAVAPELVEEYEHILYEYDEEGTQTEVGSETYLQIRDTEVKYMLMNSIKELAKENDAKDERIEELESELDAMKEAIAAIQTQLASQPTQSDQSKLAQQDVTLQGAEKVATLEQNQPNPFNENTVIKYFLPEGSTGSQMHIFSTDGKLLKTVKIDETGAGQINLRANTLPAGNYMYQLVTDSGVVASKTMVLAK